MIAISTPTFDLDGSLVSTTGRATAQSISRRAKRVPVLDLAVGAVLVDGGYSPSDQTYQLQIPDRAGEHHLFLTDLIARYPALILTCERGCYLVLLSGLGHSRGSSTCVAAVVERLN